MENTVLFVLGLLLLGAALIEIGIIIPQHINDEVNSQILQNEKIVPGNKYFNQRWINNTQEDSSETYQTYYLYNLTNPSAVVMGKVPIQIEEVGPFIFRKYYAKYNVTFWDDKVQGKVWNWYVYQQDKSYKNLPLQNVTICAGDPSFAGIVAVTRSNLTIQGLLASKFAKGAIQCLPASAWMNGYSVSLPPPLGVNITFPGYLLNQTYEQALSSGWSIWNTGIWDQYQLGFLLQYQGKQAETCWASPQQIHSSESTQFPVGLTSDQALYTYISHPQRIMRWQYDSRGSVQGLSTLKYKLDQANFQNSTLNPANAIFYQLGPSGFLNLTSCQPPLVVFVEQPHFFGCDSYFGQQFTPPIVSNSSDESYVQIEPNTGLPVGMHIALEQSRYLEVPTGYPFKVNTRIPIYWSKVQTEISSSKANDFSDALYKTKDVAQVIWWVGVVSGSFICFVALLIFIRVQVRHRRRKLLLKRSMRQSSRQRLLFDREAARTRRLTAT